jgi:hypothetical protein
MSIKQLIVALLGMAIAALILTIVLYLALKGVIG